MQQTQLFAAVYCKHLVRRLSDQWFLKASLKDFQMPYDMIMEIKYETRLDTISILTGCS